MFYTLLDFPFGSIFLAKTNKGLSFSESIKDRRKLDRLRKFFEKKGIELELNREKFRREERLFQEYFEGKREDFTSLPLDFIIGTPFQRKVWTKARKIPYGKTKTYKSLAKQMGHRGYRSVGQALSKNPLLIVIPCHRVIGSDGSLVGFGGGLDMKRYLLDLEKDKGRH